MKQETIDILRMIERRSQVIGREAQRTIEATSSLILKDKLDFVAFMASRDRSAAWTEEERARIELLRN